MNKRQRRKIMRKKELAKILKLCAEFIDSGKYEPMYKGKDAINWKGIK